MRNEVQLNDSFSRIKRPVIKTRAGTVKKRNSEACGNGPIVFKAESPQ
jgi:hypothetical protein